MKNKFIFFLIMICSVPGIAQIPDYFLPEKITYLGQNYDLHPRRPGNDDLQLVLKRPYDVLSYNLEFDWFDALSKTSTDSSSRIWNGVSGIKIKIEEDGLQQIELDCEELYIEKVVVDLTTLLPVPQPDNGKLLISLPGNYRKNDTSVIKIEYKYASRDNYCFYLVPKGKMVIDPYNPNDTQYVQERIIYTDFEPEGARYVFPCNDRPYDKAKLSVKIRVPVGYTVASNGILRDVTDSSTAPVFHWIEDSQIATYLVFASASVYTEFNDWYKKVTNPEDSIKIQYFVWNKDYQNTKTDGSEVNPRFALQKTSKMLEVFSREFCEYPFSKYGVIGCYPFFYGAMENQTITAINRIFLKGKHESILAHELAHHWFGDYVTCATWDDIWFNEGGAVWGNAVWLEKELGPAAYNYEMLRGRGIYLWNSAQNIYVFQQPVYAIPIDKIFSGYTSLSYSKASWIFQMLRIMLGEEQYFRALRNMLNRYAYKSITSEEFKESFKQDVQNSLIPLDLFFDQWLFKAGHPQLRYIFTSERINQDEYSVKVELSQVQKGNNVPDVFTIPVTFYFFGPNRSVINESVINNQREQTFTFTIPFMPDSIKIDSLQVLLEVKYNLGTVSELSKPDEGNSGIAYPNPSRTGQVVNLEYRITGNDKFFLDLIDNLGKNIKNIYTGRLSEGNYKFSFDTDGINPGVYYIILKSANKFLSKKLVIF